MKSPHQHSLAIDTVIYGLPHGDCTNHCCGCCDKLRNHPAGHKDQHASMYYTTLDVLNGVICSWFVLCYQLQCSKYVMLHHGNLIWQSQPHELVVIQAHHHTMILHV